MKKEYREPKAEITAFVTDDVITLSGGDGPIELPDFPLDDFYVI